MMILWFNEFCEYCRLWTPNRGKLSENLPHTIQTFDVVWVGCVVVFDSIYSSCWSSIKGFTDTFFCLIVLYHSVYQREIHALLCNVAKTSVLPWGWIDHIMVQCSVCSRLNLQHDDGNISQLISYIPPIFNSLYETDEYNIKW